LLVILLLCSAAVAQDPKDQKFEPSPLDDLAKIVTDRPVQASCHLTLDQAPAIRGLRLGQSIADVKAILPTLLHRESGAVEDPDIGALQAKVHVDVAAYKPAFDGIDRVNVMFLDKRLAQISIIYDHSIEWKGGDEFTARISESLRLPNAWLSVLPSNTDFLSMQCNGFLLTADVGKYSARTSLLIKQTNLDTEMDRRAKSRADQRRDSFKP
jgi:hypothetical protein